MTSGVRFEPAGVSGLVARGVTIVEAGERLGVHFVLACGGRGECDSCACEVVEGGEELSPPTTAEAKQLGDERLASRLRLACQARIGAADLTVLLCKTEAQHVLEPTEDKSATTSTRSKTGILDDMAATFETQVAGAATALQTFLIDSLRAGEDLLTSLTGQARPQPPPQPDPEPGADAGPEENGH